MPCSEWLLCYLRVKLSQHVCCVGEQSKLFSVAVHIGRRKRFPCTSRTEQRLTGATDGGSDRDKGCQPAAIHSTAERNTSTGQSRRADEPCNDCMLLDMTARSGSE